MRKAGETGSGGFRQTRVAGPAPPLQQLHEGEIQRVQCLTLVFRNVGPSVVITGIHPLLLPAFNGLIRALESRCRSNAPGPPGVPVYRNVPGLTSYTR